MPHKRFPPETIYSLIPKEEVKLEKPPRHVSVFRDQARQEHQMNRTPMKTMGPAKLEPPLPQKYLLKHSKEPRLPQKKPFSYGNCEHKPPIPHKNEWPQIGERSKRDFIKTNVAKNVKLVPPKPQPASVDSIYGDTHPLENSGLVQKYVKKKNYGQTPQYLQQRQEEMKRAQELYDEYVKECMRKGAMKQLSEVERQKIINGLKTNWDELYHQYQGLSVMTDTLRKKHRKEGLELEMKQLEIFLKLIEQHKTICIANKG